MPRVAKAKSSKDSSTATIGFEAKRCLAAKILPLLHSTFFLPTYPVLANGSMSSNQSGEGDIRRAGRKFCLGRTALFSAN